MEQKASNTQKTTHIENLNQKKKLVFYFSITKSENVSKIYMVSEWGNKFDLLVSKRQADLFFHCAFRK